MQNTREKQWIFVNICAFFPTTIVIPYMIRKRIKRITGYLPKFLLNHAIGISAS